MTPRPAPGRYPPLQRVCIDFAGLVWAVPAKHPNVAALDVGYVVKTRGRWAYETTESGRSQETYPDPFLAADALFAYLTGGAQAKQEGRRRSA